MPPESYSYCVFAAVVAPVGMWSRRGTACPKSCPGSRPNGHGPIGAAALSEGGACSYHAANLTRPRRPDQSGQGPHPTRDKPGVRRRKLSCRHGIRASGEGRNRPAKEAFLSHPPGEVNSNQLDDGSALILLAEWKRQVVRQPIHPGNPGLNGNGGMAIAPGRGARRARSR